MSWPHSSWAAPFRLAGVLYAMLFGIVPLEAIGFVFSATSSSRR